MNHLQSRCFKCHAALETPETRNVGLGETCEANVRMAFEFDKKLAGHLKINADKLVLLLSTFATSENEVSEAAFELMQIDSLASLEWSTLRKIFIAARTAQDRGNSALVGSLFEALADILPRTAAMALGEASTDAALLDFDGERVTLSATTVRKASEALALLTGVVRHGTRMWSFPLRAAALVASIVALRWPCAAISEAFQEAHARALLLPAEPPAPEAWGFELALDFHIVTFQTKVKGKYCLEFSVGDELSRWLRSEEVGGAYYKAKSTQNIKYEQNAVSAYLIPADSVEKVRERLATLFAPRPTKKGRK